MYLFQFQFNFRLVWFAFVSLGLDWVSIERIYIHFIHMYVEMVNLFNSKPLIYFIDTRLRFCVSVLCVSITRMIMKQDLVGPALPDMIQEAKFASMAWQAGIGKQHHQRRRVCFFHFAKIGEHSFERCEFDLEPLQI